MPYKLTTPKTWHEVLIDLEAVFDRWHVAAGDFRVLYDTTAVRDGRRRYFAADDREVTVEFKHPSGKALSFTTHAQQRPVDNLRAISLAIDAMRMIEVRGFGDMIGSAYLQLGAGSAPASAPPPMTLADAYKILYVDEYAPMAVVEKVYHELAKTTHPDADGDNSAMVRLNMAYEMIQEDRKERTMVGWAPSR